MSVKILVFLLFVVIHASLESKTWRQDRRPKVWGRHIPFQALSPSRCRLQRKIVKIHNFFRTRVQPSAANMLRMRWHGGAAGGAQKWADECLVLVHDNVTGRHVDGYGACGQNIFIATEKVPWLFAIETWFLEKDNFTYGSRINNLGAVGHYTQMVWAMTHQVGCGLSKCYFRNPYGREKTFYNYICNYCPAGNRPRRLGRPYRRGRPCGMCRKNCFSKKLCTNSCHVADVWANCKHLFRMWPRWLCDNSTIQSRERINNCRATCTCRNTLHD